MMDSAVQPKNDKPPRSLRFATYLAPNMEPVYRFIAEETGRRLGIETELTVGRSFDQFASGEVDVGFI